MRYHDFHLESYEVSQFGARIVLHLVWDVWDTDSDRSDICFSDVALYNFTHTAGAIILDIDEYSVSDLLVEVGSQVAEWNRLCVVKGWCNSLEEYENTLLSQGYKAWRIESAVGFEGFVIAKSVAQIGP